MKKITLIVIVFFILTTGGILVMNLLYPPTPSTTTPETSSTFTLEEVATHNTASDCYLTIKNKVYDVSTYKEKHPGGSKIITDNCGGEVTGLFASIHSNRAWDLLGDYLVGTLAP